MFSVHLQALHLQTFFFSDWQAVVGFLYLPHNWSVYAWLIFFQYIFLGIFVNLVVGYALLNVTYEKLCRSKENFQTFWKNFFFMCSQRLFIFKSDPCIANLTSYLGKKMRVLNFQVCLYQILFNLMISLWIVSQVFV